VLATLTVLALAGCGNGSQTVSESEQKKEDAILESVEASIPADSTKAKSAQGPVIDPLAREEFWQQIALIDKRALNSGDEDQALKPMIDSLATLDKTKLKSFDEQLAQVLYSLDTKPHMKHAGWINGSSDSFLYARCWVVAQGQEHYMKVLKDTHAMPKSEKEWCEALLNASSAAWQKQKGAGAEWNGWDTSVSYETGSNTTGWK